MDRARIIALALAFTALATIAHRPVRSQPLPPAPGWTTIFDVRHLGQWNPVGDANWRIVEGALQADRGAGFMVSKTTYGDFDLRAEVWVSNDANSGVFIRGEDPTAITAANAYEVNLYDERPDPAYRTGAIVNIASPTSRVDAGNRWNVFEISAKGPHITVRLNGTQTVDIQNRAHARGVIALQGGTGTVKFRTVQIK